MSNKTEHAIVGGLVGLTTYIIEMKQNQKEITIGKTILVGGLSMLAGIIPDLLEPATNPNHRSVAHSMVSGILLAIVNARINQSDLENQEKAFWKSLLFAYESHLILDATTPKSLPLLTN